MHGGPSHVDTFDPKPLLATFDGKPVPPSFGKANFQFTRMDTVPLMASQRVFKKRSQSGIEISDLFEHTAHFADDLAVVRSCYHDGFTHVIGQTWMKWLGPCGPTRPGVLGGVRPGQRERRAACVHGHARRWNQGGGAGIQLRLPAGELSGHRAAHRRLADPECEPARGDRRRSVAEDAGPAPQVQRAIL